VASLDETLEAAVRAAVRAELVPLLEQRGKAQTPVLVDTDYTEHWRRPVCLVCWDELGRPDVEPGWG